MRTHLVVVSHGRDQGMKIDVDRATLLIGREAACAVRTSNPLVSGRHCAIVREGDAAILRDLGSTNGTYLNGQRVLAEARLSAGDVIQVGTLRLRVEITSGVSVSDRTPVPLERDEGPTVDDALAVLRDVQQEEPALAPAPLPGVVKTTPTGTVLQPPPSAPTQVDDAVPRKARSSGTSE